MELYTKKNHESAKEYAYRVIRQEITTTALMPGSLISETDLANFLNISRTPVREALMMLKSEHLIEVKPQLGSFVTLIDWTLIEQAIFMRVALEKAALHEAIINFDPKTIFEMEKNLFAQQLLIKQDHDEIDFHILDQEFHQLLFIGINKPQIWESIHNISTHYNRLRILVEKQTEKSDLVEQHQQYLEVIKNKNSKNIDDLIETHIKNPTEAWPDFIKNNEYIQEYIK